jgi:hypothetical protein
VIRIFGIEVAGIDTESVGQTQEQVGAKGFIFKNIASSKNRFSTIWGKLFLQGVG